LIKVIDEQYPFEDANAVSESSKVLDSPAKADSNGASHAHTRQLCAQLLDQLMNPHLEYAYATLLTNTTVDRRDDYMPLADSIVTKSLTSVMPIVVVGQMDTGKSTVLAQCYDCITNNNSAIPRTLFFTTNVFPSIDIIDAYQHVSTRPYDATQALVEFYLCVCLLLGNTEVRSQVLRSLGRVYHEENGSKRKDDGQSGDPPDENSISLYQIQQVIQFNPGKCLEPIRAHAQKMLVDKEFNFSRHQDASSHVQVVIFVDNGLDMCNEPDLKESGRFLFDLPLPDEVRIVLADTCNSDHPDGEMVGLIRASMATKSEEDDQQSQEKENIVTTVVTDDAVAVPVIRLAPPRVGLQQQIAVQYLSVYNKRISQAQLNALLSTRSDSTQYQLSWLAYALEDIRMFGAFETVDAHIQTLSTMSMTALCECLLANLLTVTSAVNVYADLPQSDSHDESSLQEQADSISFSSRGISRKTANPNTRKLPLSELLKSCLLLCMLSARGLEQDELRTMLHWQILLQTHTAEQRAEIITKLCDDPNAVDVSNQLTLADWSVVVNYLKPFLQTTRCFDNDNAVKDSNSIDLVLPPVRYRMKSDDIRIAVTSFMMKTISPPSESPAVQSEEADNEREVFDKQVLTPHRQLLCAYFRRLRNEPGKLHRVKIEYARQLLELRDKRLIYELITNKQTSASDTGGNLFQTLKTADRLRMLTFCRCQGIVKCPTHGGGVNSFQTVNEFMCMSCSMQTNKQHPHHALNRACCGMCGASTFSSAGRLAGGEALAYRCQRHSSRSNGHFDYYPAGAVGSQMHHQQQHPQRVTVNRMIDCFYCKLPLTIQASVPAKSTNNNSNNFGGGGAGGGNGVVFSGGANGMEAWPVLLCRLCAVAVGMANSCMQLTGE
jgi:hypothetical protein